MADKNILQVDGGQTTSPINGRFYLLRPGATPSGLQDHWISESDLHLALNNRITTNEGDIISLESRMAVVESAISKILNTNVSGIYSFNMLTDSRIDSFCIKYKTGAPIINIGLNSGAGNEYIKDYEMSSTADNISLTLNELYNQTTQIDVSVIGGTIDLVRFVKVNIFT